MQDERMMSNPGTQGQEISQHTHFLLDSLQDMGRRFQELSPEEVRRILDMAIRFPESYRAAVMNGLAEKQVSTMAVHYLDILATFCQKAEQEGIDAEEQAATLADSMTDLFPMLTGLNNRLAVRTLDDLVTVAAITVGLYGLSHAESAEQAQHWIYMLPQEYVRQLTQEHLLSSPSFQFTVTVHATALPSMVGLPQVKASFVASSGQQFFPYSSQVTVPPATEAVQTIDTTISDNQTVIAA